MSKRRIASGMRPTGSLHLGNLLGALDNWIALQHDYECYFFIVDWHALTTPGDSDAVGYEHVDGLPESIRQMAIDWMSAGLDPEKCVIFVQSSVPEVAELHLLLSMITPLHWLEMNPIYKAMRETLNIKYPSYGLLGYPTLQAADILAYKGEFVPVGEDQQAHINLTSDIAKRFNRLYGKAVFPEPQIKLTEIPRVPGTNGEGKMSKSTGNYIAIADSSEVTTAKVKSMFTDPKKIRKTDKGHPDGCIVYAFHEIYNQTEVPVVREECKEGTRGCVDCKLQLALKMNDVLEPIRDRRTELEGKPDILWNVLSEGTMKARRVAGETLAEARDAMKLGKRGISL